MLKIGQGIQYDGEKGIIGRFGLGVRNDRGILLLDFCKANNLTIENAMFQQHPRRLYIWVGPDGKSVTKLTFILVKQRWTSSIKCAKILPGADIWSDHQLLVAHIRIKLKKISKGQKLQRFDLSNIDSRYTIETVNRFQALLTNTEEKTPDELWADIKDTIMTTAKKQIPLKPKRISSPWLSQEALDLADERRWPAK